MIREREATFSKWTEPASQTEESRYEWTRDNVRKALAQSTVLQAHDFSVYPKGSYPNFTNVVADSDVDIAAELTSIGLNRFAHDAEGMSVEDVGLIPYKGTYNLARFKDDVERALVAYFPAGTVRRGDKAITIRETKQGLAADVVACQTHREYTTRHGAHHEGILLRSDSDPSAHIVNYPKQHLQQGGAKNERTHKRYKRVVRILKRLENKMVDDGVIKPVPSFLIESAVFNVPNGYFTGYNTWEARVNAVLTHIYLGTQTNQCVASTDWMEANNVKFLFHYAQSWNYQQANQFALAAWRYAGFSS